VRKSGSLIAAIEQLRVGERTLRELEDEVPGWLLQIAPDASLIDPERPVDPAALLEQLVPGEFELKEPRRWLRVVLVAIAIIAIGCVVLR
jgi:phospholipase D1/2